MIAYLDLPSGISGDMMLGCLIDSGWPVEQLRAAIEKLQLPAGQWAVQVEQVHKGALRATQVDVLVEEGAERRGLADVRGIIEAGDLPRVVKERATAVFTRLASAEARVHGTTPDRVHFHEVGALDAIVDIVGSICGLHELGIERLHASALPLGGGWVQTEHGRVPLPAPATLELLAGARAPTRPAPGPGELVTPTGAALLAELATFEQPLMNIVRIGTGAGRRDLPWPNVARMWLGDREAHGPLVQLETNIDDMNPQLYAAVSQMLFEAGAKDVWLTPIQMKKGRPGVLLAVLAPADLESALAGIMLRETTTLGVRVHALRHRHEARRELRTVATPYGQVRAKIKWIGDDPAGAMPEYDDCLRLSESANVSVRIVYESAAAACQALLEELRRAQYATSVARRAATDDPDIL